MRIALVSHEYPPFHGGGIGTYAKVMSDALVRAGHEVHVVTNRFSYGSTDPRHAKHVHQEGGLWVHRIDAMTDAFTAKPSRNDRRDIAAQLCSYWGPYLYYAERVAEELARICREYAIDVAEFPECAAEGYGVIRRRRLGLAFADLPITVTLHSPIEDIYRYNLYSRYDAGFQRRSAMEEYSARWADTLSSPSRLLASIMTERLGLDPDTVPCTILPYPMDFESVPRVAAGPERADGRETLLFVGRLEQRKGVKLLIDAAVGLMASRPGLEVELAGGDCPAGEAPVKMTELLRSRIPPHLQPRVRFLGPVPRERLFARYAGATACVFPAPWDNFPLTCVEAMASGACVIGSDYSGMAEMIEHERSGLLFRGGDVAALSETIARVLDDPALAARVRAAAPTRIRAMCDPEKAVRDRIAHYEHTIERHAARARPVAAARSSRVTVLIPESGPPDAVQRTRSSVEAAARDAKVNLDVAIAKVAEAPSGNDGEQDGGLGWELARRRWRAEQLAARAPDHAICLWPGDTIDPKYLSMTLAALAANPKAAWATTWARAARPDGVPYAGLDFTLPLDVVAHHPVPFAVIRYPTLVEVGGWNLDLPLGWSDWDLWLAFARAGLEGIVLPVWGGTYTARRERTLQPPATSEARSIVLDAVVARSPELFARHGSTLWRYRIMNSVEILPEQARDGVATAPAWREWWSLTKACVVRQYPAGARLYRRVRRRPSG